MNYIINNIGIDIGDGLTNTVLKSSPCPCINTIPFVISNILEKYKISIYSGNNILSSDNLYIATINISSNEKIIYIKFTINNLLYYNNLLLVEIYTKTKLLNIYCFPIKLNIKSNINNLNINNLNINKYNYKLKFELRQCIDMINNKIKNKDIILSDDNKIILQSKIIHIIDNINNMNNQKLLEIKTNLKKKFFL